MRKYNKIRAISLILSSVLVIITAAPTVCSAASQPTVDLGTTAGFAVLAGRTITNTGTTTINGSVGGNVGLYPGSDFTGQTSVIVEGQIHVADDVARLAKEDLVLAYDDAAGRIPVTRIATELGGTTLIPGTYDSADGTFQITGTLTLDAQGDPDGIFVFKTGSTLITMSGSNINIINGARFCRTFWQVGSSATLGTNSHFVGHIFALQSIDAKTGATVQGQLMARNGAVTLDNNTITNGICETTSIVPGEDVVIPGEEVVIPITSDQDVVEPIVKEGNVVSATVTGGQLPKTSTSLYPLILIGATLTLIGVVGFRYRKRFV